MAKLPSKLPYVKFVRAKGKLYAYFNTGQRIGGRLKWAPLPAPSSTGFFDSYTTMMGHRTRRGKDVATVSGLADDFEASREFRQLANGTQRLYSITLRRIREQLGKAPIDSVERRHVREVVNNRIEGNGARNAFLAVLGVLYTYARRAELTEREPTKDMQPFKLGQHEPWPDAVLTAALMADHTRTRLAANLLYYSGQRIGDVVGIRWTDYRAGALHVTQQKTGTSLRIPVHSALARELDQADRRGETIITSQAGKRMTPQVIRRELKDFAKAHGLDLVPHGLRKNAVNALLEASCTIAETAAITGQSFKVVEHYARRVNQRKLSETAMEKLENEGRKCKPIVKTDAQPAEMLECT